MNFYNRTNFFHPLVREQKLLTKKGIIYYAELNKEKYKFLNDYKILDKNFFPGAGFMEIAIAIMDSYCPQKAFRLRDMRIKNTLILDDTITIIKIEVVIKDEKIINIELSSLDNNKLETINSTFLVDNYTPPNPPPPLIKKELISVLSFTGKYFYGGIAKNNVHYGNTFSVLDEIKVNKNVAAASVTFTDTDFLGYKYHPTLIYGAFQLFTLFLAYRSIEKNTVYLPSYIHDIYCYKSGILTKEVYIELDGNDPNIANIYLSDGLDVLMKINFGITKISDKKAKDLIKCNLNKNINTQQDMFINRINNLVVKTLHNIAVKEHDSDTMLDLAALIVISATRIVSIF